MSAEGKRDELLELVRRGEVTREAAEGEARQHGIHLLSRPDPENFNPLKQRNWTLAMALAWIAWRRIGKVRDFSNDYRTATEYWAEHPGVAGPFPKTRFRASVWSMLELGRVPGQWSVEYYDQTVGMPAAWEELSSALSSGMLACAAVHVPTLRTQQVLSAAWSHYNLGQDNWFNDKHGDVDALFAPRGGPAVVYSYPLVDGRIVQEHWKKPSGLAIERPVDEPPRTQHEAIQLAIRELWPEGVPQRAKLRANERDTAVVAWLNANGYRVPTGLEAVAKAVQRAIGDMPDN